MDSKATAKYVRMSPRKVRLVVDIVRGLSVQKAEHALSLLNKKAARPVSKVLHSAIANAEHNFDAKKSELFVKFIAADEGPTLKRWQPRAFGRASMIRKRTTHITVVVSDGKEATADTKIEKKAEEPKQTEEKKLTKKETTSASNKSTKKAENNKSTKSKTTASKK